MAKINSIQSSFLLGEVSPRTRGRTDNEQYMQMCKELINLVAIPQGGVQTRPGSQLQVHTTQDIIRVDTGATTKAVTALSALSAKKLRQIAFKTADGKKWIIIMNNGKLSTWGVMDVTNLKLYPMISAGETLLGSSLTTLMKGQVTGWTDSAQELDFTAIDLEEIQVHKSGDVLFLAHESMPPLTIRYILTNHLAGGNNYLLPIIGRYDCAFLPRGAVADAVETHQVIPFLEPNQLNNQGNGYISYPAPSATAIGGTMVLTSSEALFRSTWVRAFIRFNNIATGWSAVAVITAYTNTTTVSATIIQCGATFPADTTQYGVTANMTWEMSAWNAVNGYPSAVTGFDSRIIYGGTLHNPNRVWITAVNDVDELNEIPYAQDPTYATYNTDESRAFYRDIDGAEILRWMTAGKRIFVGAQNREYTIFSDEIFGPSTIRVAEATRYGSAYRPPTKMGQEVLFTQRSGQRIRSIVFSFQEDDFKSQDISRISEHICRASQADIEQQYMISPEFGAMAVQTSPDARIWVTDSNGGLSSCTFDREAGVAAWSRHRLGGNDGHAVAVIGRETPFVCSAVTLPAYDNEVDEIYLIVKRVINSTATVTLEKIGGYFNEQAYTNPWLSPANATPDWMRFRSVLLDCAMGSVSVAATATFTFASLLNEIVDVIADGEHLGKYTLNGSGVLTLPSTYKEVIVGYEYTPQMTLVDFELAGIQGSSQGKMKTVPEVILRINRTANVLVKREGQTDWQRAKLVFDVNESDGPVELYTGDIRVHVGNVDRNMCIMIKNDKPLPFELLAVIFQGMIYD